MRALGAVVVVALAASATARAGEPSPEVDAARARQMAGILGVESILSRIERAPAGGGLDAIVTRLELRDDIVAELQRIALVINAAIAQLDEERSAAAGAQSFVESGYARAVAGWNIAALIVGNSLTIVGTAMQFDGTAQAYTGDGLILGGAAMATAFSIVALTRKSQGPVPHAIDTNYLAPLFGELPTAESVLPALVWRYLDTPLAGEPASLRAQLLERWVRRGTVPADRSPAALRKIALLTRPLSSRQKVPADVLEDRAEMLSDLRARIAGMHVDVQRLVRYVRAERVTP